METRKRRNTPKQGLGVSGNRGRRPVNFTRVLSVGMSEDMAGALVAEAEAQGCTISDLIRACVGKALPTMRDTRERSQRRRKDADGDP